MKKNTPTLIPRNLSWNQIQRVLFPEKYSQTLPIQTLFREQATASLFLIMLLASLLSVVIIIFGLGTNIDLLQFSKSLFGLLGFFLTVLVVHKIQPFPQTDYHLLLITVFFIASWGIAKDIINFNFFFNKFGIFYITLLFFGMILMPFRPIISFYLGLYCTLFYFILWIILVQKAFGVEWIDFFGQLFHADWLRDHASHLRKTQSPFPHYRFYSAWLGLRYLFYGSLAFIFRAANVQSFLHSLEAKEKLHAAHNDLQTMERLLSQTENQYVEFKSALRWDVFREKVNKDLEQVIIKTIAGFMNADGGTLFIGVDDNGKPLGLEHDYQTLKRKDADGYEQLLIRLISDYLGKEYCSNVQISFLKIGGNDICVLTVLPDNKPVFVEKMEQSFFVRTGNNTQRLNTREAMEYIDKHFHKNN